VFEMIELVKKG